MKTLRRGWRRLLGSLSREKSDLTEELQSHLEMQIDDNLRAGMPPEEARRQARLKFGGIDSTKEGYRDQRGLPWLETTFADLRYAARTLRNSPSFTIVAVLTLAVGIGANTAIFSLVNQLLLHPAGIDHPERIVAVRTRYGKQGADFTGASPTALTELRASKQVFERAALADGNFGNVNYTGGDTPERLQGAGVSEEWFDVFGATPLLGRVFTAEEDQPNRNRVVVLSHAAWTRLFGADRNVIGRAVQLNQAQYQIIGVMKPDFRLPRGVELWMPAGLRPEMYAPPNRFNESAFIAARTQPGVSYEQANAWLGVVTDRVRNSNTKGAVYAKNSDWRISVQPFVDSYAGAGDNKMPLLLLSGAVGFVLLIACSNIAGLMVARTAVRGRELAVRTALGASRSRLVRQLLSESLLLAAVGGAAGLALALGAVRILLLLAPGNSEARLHTGLDSYVLGFCAVATVLSGILFALAPAWQLSRSNPQAGLKMEGRSNTTDAGKQRFRSLLVVGETALALTLLVTAGLFIRSYLRLQEVNPGLNPRGVMTAMFVLPPATLPVVLEQVRAAPGVTAAGLGWPLPFSYNNQAGDFAIEGRVTGSEEPRPHGDRRRVSPGYMEAFSIPLKRGRYFTNDDRINTEPVTIIDENLARQYWPNEDPLGKHIRLTGDGQPWYTIVGIVGHVMHPDLASDSGKGVYYFSLFQGNRQGTVAIVVKTSGDSAAMAGVIRDAVRAADPNQAVHTMQSMEGWVSASLSNRRFGVRLLSFFGMTALFLATLGLYGVISYSVAQRTREIGIRIALGAERMNVMKLVVGQGFRLAAIGVAIGIMAAALAGRFLESQLFQVSALDPLTIFATAAALLAAGLLASYLPARRAVRVDPAVTLRCD